MLNLTNDQLSSLDKNGKILERLFEAKEEKKDVTVDATLELAASIKLLAERDDKVDITPVLEAIEKSSKAQESLIGFMREEADKPVPQKNYDFQIHRTTHGQIRSVSVKEGVKIKEASNAEVD